MEPISLEGKVALITGGSRGMGREMALAYARAGAAGITVTAAAAPDETEEEIRAALDGVVAEIEAAGGNGLGVYANVTSWADSQRAVAETVGAFGSLQILVNNAGMSQRYHGARNINFWETDPEGWRMVIETNVVGPYLMAKAAVPEMLKGGFGRIINITKSADSMHTAQSGAYGPSKAALEAEAISWAEELDGTGVTVTCLQPGGAVNTLFGRGAILDRGLPVDVIVNGALWLASDEAGEYNGCRFDAKKWDESLPNDKAGPASRMEPLFPTPERETKLAHAWEKPA